MLCVPKASGCNKWGHCTVRGQPNAPVQFKLIRRGGCSPCNHRCIVWARVVSDNALYDGPYTVVEPSAFYKMPSAQSAHHLAIFIVAVGAAVVGYCIRAWTERPRGKPLELPEPVELPLTSDDPSYQKALARSRQAVHVQKAVFFRKAGEYSRAMIELGRALQENGVCRSPLLCGQIPREELLQLYTLHLNSVEVPANFAILLQLREMLGLTRKEAEQLEEQVLAAGETFSI